jgi:transposase InsO family protein
MLADDYPVSVACRVLRCARSSYYHQSTEPDETALKAAIEAVAAEWPMYGSRRVTAQLRRQGWTINRKRVQRLMRHMDIQVAIQRKVRKTTDSEHGFPRYPNLVQGLAAAYPDHIWVSDITYIRLLHDFVYLAVIMDVFTRCVRGWHLGRSLDHSLTLTALRRALTHHVPHIHHSDQGVQYAATTYTQALLEAKTKISMAEVGQAWQNGYAERLIRTIKEEEVDLSEYIDYNDAYRQLGRFLDEVYLHKRIHSSLGYLTPAEFEAQWQQMQTLTCEVDYNRQKPVQSQGSTSSPCFQPWAQESAATC